MTDMITLPRAEVQMALDALEGILLADDNDPNAWKAATSAIFALRERLAQTETKND